MILEERFREDLQEWRWYLEVRVGKKRVRRADFLKRQEALDYLALLRSNDIYDELGLLKPAPKVTIGDLLKKVESDATVSKRDRQLFAQFVEEVKKEVGDIDLASLKRADWTPFAKALLKRNLKPGSYNRYISAVSGLLSSAIDRFRELEDWKWEAPKAPFTRDTGGRNRVLKKEEIKKLLDACLEPRQHYEQYFSVENRREIYDLFQLMLLTGAREGEVLGLKESQINWEERTAHIVSWKGGRKKERDVPFCAKAWEVLMSRRNKSKRFFTLNRDRLYRALKRVAEMAEVDYGDNVEDGFVFYDIRHTAATKLAYSRIPHASIAALLGHTPSDMTSRYINVVGLDALWEAVEVLENYLFEEVLQKSGVVSSTIGRRMAGQNGKRLQKTVND